MNRPTIAELIVAIEPEMRELIRLREEIRGMRFRASPPTPSVHELIAATPLTIKQESDGLWWARIALVNPTDGTGALGTGVGGCATDVEAFKLAVSHLATLLAREWERDEEEE
jgi:hypothetical protein